MKSLENVAAIDLELTTVCNAACGFCPRELMPDRKQFLPLEVVERLAHDLSSAGLRKVVVLCGIGESTLHPQLDEIVRTLAGAGQQVEMTTHGGRMTPERFQELVEAGLSGFNFSINALTAETHSAVMRLSGFDRIVANLEHILKLRRTTFPGVNVHVSCVMCALNEHEVEGFVERWRRHAPSRIWLHPVNNRAGALPTDLKPIDPARFVWRYRFDPAVRVDVFAHQREEGGVCKIAGGVIFISAEGKVRLCAMDYRRQTSYGSLLERSLGEMHDEKLAGYARGDMDGFCHGCDFCPPAVADRAVGLLELGRSR